MSLPSLPELQWFVAVIAIGSAVAAAVKLLPPAVQFVSARTWQPIANHFRGVHRMFTTVEMLVGQIAEIKKEVTTNGGGSLKDQVIQIGARVDTIEGRQSAIFDGQNRASFQADPAGRFTSVNRAFERRTGFPARDLLGKRWVNLLHEEDVDDFMRVWEHMLRDGRPLRKPARIMTADGTVVEITVDACPILKREVVIEYQGSFDGLEVRV